MTFFKVKKIKHCDKRAKKKTKTKSIYFNLRVTYVQLNYFCKIRKYFVQAPKKTTRAQKCAPARQKMYFTRVVLFIYVQIGTIKFDFGYKPILHDIN